MQQCQRGRSGRRASVTLLLEDGSGEPYDHPHKADAAAAARSPARTARQRQCEYTGARKEIRPVTIGTYQVLTTKRKGAALAYGAVAGHRRSLGDLVTGLRRIRLHDGRPIGAPFGALRMLGPPCSGPWSPSVSRGVVQRLTGHAAGRPVGAYRRRARHAGRRRRTHGRGCTRLRVTQVLPTGPAACEDG